MSSTKTIAEQISGLLRLQEVDAKIYELMRQKNAKPYELQGFRAARDQKRQEAAMAERLLTELQLKRKNKEMELETKEDAIKKYQIQLYQVKTNKEYLSLQQEIELLKADKSVLEEDILKIMDEVDVKRAEMSQKKEQLATEESRLATEEVRIAKEIEAIDRELVLLKEKRQTFIPDVERTLFIRYERILVGKDGLALVPVDDYSCLGCHMALPPQVINEVRLQEKIVTCENCSRILYYPGEAL